MTNTVQSVDDLTQADWEPCEAPLACDVCAERGIGRPPRAAWYSTKLVARPFDTLPTYGPEHIAICAECYRQLPR